jgi:hypothetical protein
MSPVNCDNLSILNIYPMVKIVLTIHSLTLPQE